MQTHNFISAHHAHLWISDQLTLSEQVILQLQKKLCPNHGCNTCIICSQIEQKQHPWITWLQPEGSYSLEDIDQILQSVRFTLDTHEQRFFIFTNAQELTPACSNRLLKTIEEPHPGYFFIFLATKADDILPTLTSRCFFKQFAQQSQQHTYEEIMEPFVTSSFLNPIGFMKNIERLNIKEQETKEIVDLLLQHFHAQLTKHHAQVDFNAQNMLSITDKIILIRQALTQLPIPGSSKLFWKNLYITFHYNA